MFRHEGPTRSLKKNAGLAGYLAFVAGFVNSGGFLLIGSFTSHVTGSVGRASIDVATGEVGKALLAALMVLGFFVGAATSTVVVEGHEAHHVSRAYGKALLIESGLLGSFIFVAGLSQTTHPLLLDAEGAILCAAMGLQNSLVTRLSGAVIRTTHLTGVVTDLGIEAGRWYRWHRAKLVMIPSLLTDGKAAIRPTPATSLLLLTIVIAFATGAMLGAWTTAHISRWAMAAPAVAVLFAALIAFEQDRRGDHPTSPVA